MVSRTVKFEKRKRFFCGLGIGAIEINNANKKYFYLRAAGTA